LNRTSPIHVVAGVLTDAGGRVLLAQRPAGKHLAGGWEFPGGKLDAGEARRHGLYRELAEELGVAALHAHPLIRVRHRYPQRTVLLDVWVVTRYRGVPAGRDGQRLRWCRRSALQRADLLAADRPVIAALRLPERLTASATRAYRILPIDDARWNRPQRADRLRGAWCEGAADAVAAAALDDARFLVLRRALAPAALAALCNAVNLPVFARGIRLQQAWKLGATGLNEIRA